MTKDEMRTRALELRASGLGYRRISEELGVGRTTIRRLVVPGYNEHLNRLSLEAKRRRSGRCVDCGAPTRYGGGEHAVSVRCVPCGKARSAARTHERLGKGPTQQALRTLLLEHGEMQLMEIFDAFGGSRNGWGGRIDRYLKLGLIERVSRGRYRWIAG